MLIQASPIWEKLQSTNQIWHLICPICNAFLLKNLLAKLPMIYRVVSVPRTPTGYLNFQKYSYIFGSSTPYGSGIIWDCISPIFKSILNNLA
jgi:hypothetical protein